MQQPRSRAAWSGIRCFNSADSSTCSSRSRSRSANGRTLLLCKQLRAAETVVLDADRRGGGGQMRDFGSCAQRAKARIIQDLARDLKAILVRQC